MNEAVFQLHSYASRGLSSSLAAYRKRVFELVDQKSGEAIYNGSIEHASIVIEALFTYAKSTVKILTGVLNPAVYGSIEVILAAHTFLSKPSSRIDLLLEDPSAKPLNPFFSLLGDRKNLFVRCMPQHVRINYRCHCAIADTDGYRFEADKEKPFAVAAFGDTKGGNVLNELFSELWGLAEDYNEN